MPKANPFIFRQYDIRGKVAQDFPEDVVTDLGRGFGTYVRNKGGSRCAISGDVRLTTPRLVRNFTDGLLSTGMDVVDLGQLPTPANYFSTFAMDVDAAVQVTGSHNPPEFNGFKLTLNRGPVFGDEIQQIRSIVDSASFQKGSGRESTHNINDEYAAMLKSKIRIERPIRMVMDCGNGAAALGANEILQSMGITTDAIFADPDGTFPNHHPDPTIEKNLQDLIKRVKSAPCDLGVAFDGDADRVGAVDENGQVFWADILMALFLPELEQKYRGSEIVFDVKCSQALEETIIKHGFRPHMCETGHSILKKKMKELGCPFAGELSGHIFFGGEEFYGFDDAIYVAARLAQLLSRSDRKLSELLAELPQYHSSPEIRVSFENDAEKFRIAQAARKFFTERYECITIDGIRIKFADGWALARASNTQADITCRFEATTADRLKEIEELVLGKLRELGAPS